MLKFNNGFNTYDGDSFSVQFKDCDQPDLYRDYFPYTEAPRIGFNHRLNPMCMPANIWITDTSFRDGQQSMPPYTVKQVVELYTLLHRLGGPKGLIRQAEFFLYTKKDQQAISEVLSLGVPYPEVTGWIRALQKDVALVKNFGLKETGILTSVSDYHIFLKLKKSRRQVMDDYLRTVKECLSLGITPRCHFEDATRADFYGFVVPFAHELMKLADESKSVIKIRVCDTLGLGVPYPGVSLPRSVPGLIYGLQYYSGVPSDWLEWHGHNDLHLVTANATTAWLYGCSVVNGTMLGIGERTGNPPLEGMIMQYLQLRGNDCSIDTTIISEIAEYFEKNLGFQIPANYPLVGKDFNMTRAGIHADGLLKNEEIYNIFDTAKMLNRPVSIAITDKSGLAGVALWVHNKIGRGAASLLTKDHPGVARIYKWICEQYEEERTTSISDAEMLAQVRLHLSDWIKESGFEV